MELNFVASISVLGVLGESKASFHSSTWPCFSSCSHEGVEGELSEYKRCSVYGQEQRRFLLRSWTATL